MSGLVQALDQLPKVELHCHVEGTMRATTLIELADRQGIALPITDPTELYRYDSLTGSWMCSGSFNRRWGPETIGLDSRTRASSMGSLTD